MTDVLALARCAGEHPGLLKTLLGPLGNATRTHRKGIGLARLPADHLTGRHAKLAGCVLLRETGREAGDP